MKRSLRYYWLGFCLLLGLESFADAGLLLGACGKNDFFLRRVVDHSDGTIHSLVVVNLIVAVGVIRSFFLDTALVNQTMLINVVVDLIFARASIDDVSSIIVYLFVVVVVVVFIGVESILVIHAYV